MIKTETAEVAALTERYAEYDSMVAVEENTEPVVPDAPVEPEKQGLSDWGIIGIAAIVAVMLIIVITVAGNKSAPGRTGSMETSSCKDVRKRKKTALPGGGAVFLYLGIGAGGEAPGNSQRRVTGSSNFSTPFIPPQRVRPPQRTHGRVMTFLMRTICRIGSFG